MSLLSSRTLEDRVEPGTRPSSALGHARTIGVLSLDPSPYGKANLLSGIQDVTRESDYCVSILSPAALGRESVLGALERMRRMAVDGVLVLAPQRAAIEMLAGAPGELPLLVLGSPYQDFLSAVTSDHYAAAATATSHLLELGHQSVFHIAGPLDGSEPGSRLAGWRDTLRAAGAEVPDAMIGDGSAEGGYELGRRLAPPGEVSVVGFGGAPEGEFFNPPLTTIRQNFTEMGRRGAELLQAEIEAGRLARVQETIPAELILRASTAARSVTG